jgi:hypothetical protein
MLPFSGILTAGKVRGRHPYDDSGRNLVAYKQFVRLYVSPMRRANLTVDRMDVADGAFVDLYRHYVQICREEGVEPMGPKALLGIILKALAFGEEIRESGPTLH